VVSALGSVDGRGSGGGSSTKAFSGTSGGGCGATSVAEESVGEKLEKRNDAELITVASNKNTVMNFLTFPLPEFIFPYSIHLLRGEIQKISTVSSKARKENSENLLR
jgi:hypothetical protein